MGRLALTALLALVCGVLVWQGREAGAVPSIGDAYSEPVTEADSPPGIGTMWLKDRVVAVYDADSSVWLSTFEDVYAFGRNSTTAGNEWLRFGPNGSASSPGDPIVWASAQGYTIRSPSVITAVDFTLSGDWTSTRSCTLMVCQSVTGAGIDTLSFIAFPNVPTGLGGEHKDVWVPVDSAAVISAYLKTGASTVNNPNFLVRIRQMRTP